MVSGGVWKETQASRFPVVKTQKSLHTSFCTENNYSVPQPGPSPGSPRCSGAETEWGLPLGRASATAGRKGCCGGSTWSSARGQPLPSLTPRDSLALVSAHLSQEGVSEGLGAGDMVEGQSQKERGPKWVQALSRNLMNK